MARWIGVDLDGTLAKSVSSIGTGIGEPATPMLNRVKQWLSRGQEVRVFTARASDPQQVTAIRAWLKRHDIGECGITNRKDLDMIELYDDKAKRVVKDSGRICSGCRSQRNSREGEDFAAGGVQLTDC